MGSATLGFSAHVTNVVKAELARRGLSGSELTGPLGIGRNAVYARLRHERSFTTDELEKIAIYLRIPVADLFQEAQRQLSLS